MGRGKNLRSDQIAQITCLCQAKHSNKEIGAITGISSRSIQRWTKKFRESTDGDVPLQRKSKGKPKLLSPRTLKMIKRQVDENPTLTARQLKDRNPLLLQDVSIRTIQRALCRDLGYRCYVAKRVPRLTARQMRNRLKYAKDKVKWQRKKLYNVLWSDESTFKVSEYQTKYVRRRPGSDAYDPKFTVGTVKQPDRLMVWGSIGYHGLGHLVVLPRNQTMTAKRYRNIVLKPYLKQSLRKAGITRNKAIFQQDGATFHTAKLIGTYLDNIGIQYIKPWPGNSPDLNPIEHVWARMKQQLQHRDTSTLEKLGNEIQDTWKNMDRTFIKNLIDSVPNRLQEVIDRKGKATSY